MKQKRTKCRHAMEVEEIYTATSVANDESDPIFLNLLDDLVPKRHHRKRREFRGGERRRVRRATGRCWRRRHYEKPSLLSSLRKRSRREKGKLEINAFSFLFFFQKGQWQCIRGCRRLKLCDA